MIEVVMCIVKKEDEILLVHRKGKDANLSWAFPGGTVEQGETVEQTAIRELKEETNVDGQFDCIIGDRVHPYSKKHMAYVAMSPLSFDLKLGDEDLDDLQWVKISELSNYIGNNIYDKVKEFLKI